MFITPQKYIMLRITNENTHRIPYEQEVIFQCKSHLHKQVNTENFNIVNKYQNDTLAF